MDPSDPSQDSSPLPDGGQGLAQSNCPGTTGETAIRYILRLVPSPKFEHIDASAHGLTGRPAEAFYKNPRLLLQSIHPEDRAALQRELDCPSGAPLSVRWLRPDGSVLWSEHRLTALLDPLGRLAGVEGEARELINESSALLRRMARTTGELRFIPGSGPGKSIGRSLMDLSQAQAVVMLEVNRNRLEPFWVEGISLDASGGLLDELESLAGGLAPSSQALYFTPPNNGRGGLGARLRQGGWQAAAVCALAYQEKLLALGVCLYRSAPNWSVELQGCLAALSQHAAVVLENARLRSELETARLESVLALARMMEARDAYISSHGHSLVGWCELVAHRLGMAEERIDNLNWAALLHDIGKVGIPDSILTKPASLSAEEWARMRQHPEIGEKIISSIQRLQSAAPIIRAHHEHYDGSGYPQGLAGDQIPLEARILAVVDAFCAMIDTRVYRPARSAQEALDELQRCAGGQFDPRVVRAFVEVRSEGMEAEPAAARFWQRWSTAPGFG